MGIFDGQARFAAYISISSEKRYNHLMESVLIEETLGSHLAEKGYFLATAESCTGGLIASRITNIPGSSQYFLGSMITYSNQAKTRWLGVKEETLAAYGAVSRPTVEEMALGLVRNLEGFCSPAKLLTLAVSGIAGPNGGTPGKPVGYVWIAWSFNAMVRSENFHFQGERISIKEQSADQALLGAWQWLQKLSQ